MDKILVHGGSILNGNIRVSGSKNSALPILAACLLTKEPCIIRHVPDLSDVHYMLQILHQLGAEVERASGTVIVRAENIQSLAPYDLVRKMRASVCVLGPLLARMKEATVSLPGGCVIGDRPIDLHLRGFEALGATVRVECGNVHVFAPIENGKTLRGTDINLRGKFGSTVLGTDNIMMAAVLAEGVTVIEGAAAEPEVVDLAQFLNAMGAKVEGAGTRRIVIEGVKELHGAEHAVIPDRIEAGTFMVAAAIAGSRVTLRRIVPEHLQSVTDALRQAGYTVEIGSGHGNGENGHPNGNGNPGHNGLNGSSKRQHHYMTIVGNGKPKPLELVTEPYPNFPTDMQAQMCALLCCGEGISVVTESIFPQRFMHVAELKRMGAKITLEGASAIIKGVECLSGAPVMASDLRASAALVLAGLQASGVTEINRVYHIDRGYESIDDKLNGIGAQIERVKA